MKLLSRHIILLFSVLLLAACTDEFPVEKSPQQYILDGDYYFVLADESEPTSRLQYDGILHSEFTTGDRIGIFAPQNADKTQIPNDVFTARDMTDDPPSGPHQVLVPCDDEIKKEVPEKENEYLLYYPYVATQSLTGVSNGNMKFTVKEEQKTEANLKASDLLWCHKLLTAEEKEAQYITIHMNHAMANIVIKVAKDSVDTDHDVTLLSIPTEATGIKLRYDDGATEMSLERMSYGINPDSKKDITMFRLPDDTDEYNYVYRAIVPACQTVTKDTDIFTLFIKNKTGEFVSTTYKLAQDIELRPGKYYTFNLRSGQKPAIPDVTDDESWVLDVFDPETNEVVGLLCREYIRYQPKVERTDKEFITGTPYEDTKYILSQAWVFYNLKEGYENEKIINLDKGTVLRFIYDLRTSNSNYTNHTCKGRWPMPHIGTDGGGGGMFAVAHSHVWDYDATNYYTSSGYSSDLYQWRNDEYVENGHNDPATGELYMHGGTITWGKTSGVHPFNSDSDLEYYHIESFIMPELRVTNHDAFLYGHIAIDANGNVNVSYNPYDENTKRELSDNTVKVGYTKPHYLNDIRGDEATAYPVVKIGYNNFWMSRSLHTKCLNDGTPLTDHYDTINKETASFDMVEKTAEDGSTYMGYPELEKGFLYPYRKADDAEFDSRNADTFDDYPLLYNFVAYSDEKFIPLNQSVDIDGLTRFNVKIPDEEEIGAILNYFGIACASKLMSAAFRPAIENSYNKVYDLQQALLHKCYTDDGYNFYVANVSGFNLHAMGGFTSNSFNQDLGRQLSMWLLLPENERYTTTEENGVEKSLLNLALLRFDNYSAFSATGNLDQIVHKVAQQPTGDYSQIPIRHAIFYPVRYFMRMKHQQNTQDNTEIVKSVKSAITRQHKVKASADNESKMVNVRIVKSESEK